MTADTKVREVHMTHRRKPRTRFDLPAYRRLRRFLRPMWREMQDRYARGGDANFAVRVSFPEPKRPRRAPRREELI